ncbi:MAG: hypothetical protein ABFR75_09915 [Acidobacteriota bacterium]
MVINEEHKLLFIGIPYSASSAIIKELIENYKCTPLMHKHANIPFLLKKRKDINLQEYHITAVKRNPIEIEFSVYNKMKTNAYGVFTNEDFFLEKGGHVRRKARQTFQKIHNNKWTFIDYLKNTYSIIPYDNFLSENKKYVDQWIDFENLEAGFSKMLKTTGIIQKRPLPVYNKTKKVISGDEVPEKMIRHIFGPFIFYNDLNKYNYSVKNIGLINYLKFLIFRKIKHFKWKKRDKLTSRNLNSSYD